MAKLSISHINSIKLLSPLPSQRYFYCCSTLNADDFRYMDYQPNESEMERSRRLEDRHLGLEKNVENDVNSERSSSEFSAYDIGPVIPGFDPNSPEAISFIPERDHRLAEAGIDPNVQPYTEAQAQAAACINDQVDADIYAQIRNNADIYSEIDSSSSSSSGSSFSNVSDSDNGNRQVPSNICHDSGGSGGKGGTGNCSGTGNSSGSGPSDTGSVSFVEIDIDIALLLQDINVLLSLSILLKIYLFLKKEDNRLYVYIMYLNIIQKLIFLLPKLVYTLV